MIEAVYISHTQECSGWDLDSIISGTVFKKAASAAKFPKGKEAEDIKMIDWDFRGAKKDFKKTWKKFIGLVKSYDFDLVFGPDSYIDSDPIEILKLVEKIKEFAKRVVIPIHGYFDLYEDYELGFPNGQGFNPTFKNYWVWMVKDSVSHILGGSPHSHLEYMYYLKKVKTLDGNQMFNCAVYFGKYWDGKWVKPDEELTNEECFRKSINNFDKRLREGGFTR